MKKHIVVNNELFTESKTQNGEYYKQSEVNEYHEFCELLDNAGIIGFIRMCFRWNMNRADSIAFLKSIKKGK